MKNLYLLSFIFIIGSLSLSKSVQASHYMGGEITWECIPAGSANAGKYIFQLKVYRECAGVQFGSTQIINSNSPAGNIQVTEISGWPKDISPVCNSNPNFSHITCANATASNMGAVEEHIYRSQPILITGTPPANGWTFYWGSCCRNAATNIVNANSKSWTLRAIMYPYGTQNVYPCFDDSPTFAEVPQSVVCAGYPTNINYLARDFDLDSLSYEWGTPLLSNGSPLTNYVSGYSYQNPLPDSTINPNNIAGKVNKKSGDITFTSFTTGAFVTSLKVTAFKDGVKVAEIWRDMQIVIANCGTNTQPQFTITYPNGQAVVADTINVVAGDSISLYISVGDTQLLPNGAHKSMEMRINGLQFGAYIPSTGGNPPTLSRSTGCINPPCAILSPAPGPNIPITDSSSVQTHFTWQTDCGHVYLNTCCRTFSNTYRFSFMAKDDFCPVPGTINKNLYIRVIRTPIPIIKTNNIHYNYTMMTADFSWKKYIDPDTSFIAYYIYHSNSLNGPYTLIDSIKNINKIVYSHNIGLAQQSYYYLRTRALSCGRPYFSLNSDTLSLDITVLNSTTQTRFELFQNEPNPANSNTKIRYTINKPANGNFRLIDLAGRIILERNIVSKPGMNLIELATSDLSDGVYYYSLSFDKLRRTKKLIIIK